MSLFAICPACCEETQDKMVQKEGTFIKIKQICSACGFHRVWRNQCKCISARTYFRHQHLYTITTTVQAWKTEQGVVLEKLREKHGGLILSGDCSSEVPNSTWCELEGLKRSMNFITEQKMHVSALVTDRNRQVAKWVREKLCPEGTKHFFDIWHLSKGLKKALDDASKERHCEDLKLWTPAIINHLYWTAASTPDGNPDVMEAKWTSMVSHVQDIHDHDTHLFPVCAHPNLEGEARDKQWLQPGSMAAIKLETVATRATFVKDVRQLSPQHQTYSLEAFYSLILHFAPKHTGFSFPGMYRRLLLAALHFNHNSDSEISRTRDGEMCYAVRYPRFSKGSWVICPIKDNSSFEYAFALMDQLKETYAKSPKSLTDSSAILYLSASFQRIPKEQAVSQYQAQHSRFAAR